jgi:hypothetical protein
MIWRQCLDFLVLLVGVVTLASCGMLARPITAADSPSAFASSAATANPPPGSLAYLDAKNGFRDLTFGDPPPEGMLPTEEDGDRRVYVRPDDELTIGGAHMRRMTYTFYKDRFAAVRLHTTTLADGRALLAVLQQAFGPGMKDDPKRERYTWVGQQVSVTYEEHTIGHEAEVWWRSQPLIREQAADDQAKVSKGVSQL